MHAAAVFASAVKKSGIKRGEVISVLAFNTPEMVELQFAVAMAGGIEYDKHQTGYRYNR